MENQMQPSETVKILEQFNLLEQAILDNNKNRICYYRPRFIDVCINYADTFRVQGDPHVESMGQKGPGRLRKAKSHT